MDKFLKNPAAWSAAKYSSCPFGSVRLSVAPLRFLFSLLCHPPGIAPGPGAYQRWRRKVFLLPSRQVLSSRESGQKPGCAGTAASTSTTGIKPPS